MNYKTVIFDFDGTIADTFLLVIKIVNQNKEKFGIDGIDESEIPKLRGMSINYLLREFGLSILKVPSLVRFVQKNMTPNMHLIKPFEGIPELLKELQQHNIKLAMLTSNTKVNVDAFLSSHNLQVFEHISAEPKYFGKTNALKKILDRMSITSDEVIYIGDEVRDISACHKGNIKICSVTWGYNSKEILSEHNPDFLVDNVAQLKKVLLG